MEFFPLEAEGWDARLVVTDWIEPRSIGRDPEGGC